MTSRIACIALALAALGLASRGDDPKPRVTADLAERAIRAAVEEFRRAFAKGDAQAVAATFTEDAEIVDQEGRTAKGRPAIAQVFAAIFTAQPGATIEIVADSVRTLAPGVAIEEGRATIKPADSGEAEVTRYEAVHVLRDGRWLQARVRDFPDEGGWPQDRLEPLSWLVGDWVDEGDGELVTVSCTKVGDGWLVREFRLLVRGGAPRSATQRIGWDAATESVRSWTFDDAGGRSEETWAQDESGRWIIKATAVLADGRRATATNILERTGPDSARFSSVDRTLGSLALPGSEEYLMVRRPSPPK